jgi:hypothetical protein
MAAGTLPLSEQRCELEALADAGLYRCTGLVRSAIMLADLAHDGFATANRESFGCAAGRSSGGCQDSTRPTVLESDRAEIVAAHARHERNKAEMSLDPTGGYRLETA